jgi:hypothetical protein
MAVESAPQLIRYEVTCEASPPQTSSDFVSLLKLFFRMIVPCSRLEYSVAFDAAERGVFNSCCRPPPTSTYYHIVS